MNLGQAVAVCLYELRRFEGVPEPERASDDAVEGAEAERLTKMMLEVLDRSGYTNRITAVSTEEKIRRWIRRLRLSRRDTPLLLGILRQVLWKLEDLRR
jgi:tRNA/rRNA methyltransferase